MKGRLQVTIGLKLPAQRSSLVIARPAASLWSFTNSLPTRQSMGRLQRTREMSAFLGPSKRASLSFAGKSRGGLLSVQRRAERASGRRSRRTPLSVSLEDRCITIGFPAGCRSRFPCHCKISSSRHPAIRTAVRNLAPCCAISPLASISERFRTSGVDVDGLVPSLIRSQP